MLTYANLGALTYDADDQAANQLTVAGASAATTYTINGGYSAAVNIGNGDLSAVSSAGAFGTLKAFAVNSPASVVVNDQYGSVGRTYTLSAGSLTVAGQLLVTYPGPVPSVTLYAGRGNDAITVLGSNFGGLLTVNGGAGNDLITVGSPSVGFAEGLGHAMTVAGDGGTDTLTAYEQGDNDDLAVSPTVVGFADGATPFAFITYSGMAAMTLYGGESTAGGSVTVLGTAAGTPVTVATSSGTDPITVDATDPTAPVTVAPSAGNDPVTVGVGGSAAVVDFAATQSVGPLTVNAGSRAVVTAGPRKLLRVTTLAVTGTGAALDLTDNDLDVTTTATAVVRGLVAAGFASGWSGSGIVSGTAAADPGRRTALAVVNNGNPGSPLFAASNPLDGQTPGATDTIVRYTYYGDANLDGKVNGMDYARVDAGYGQHLTGWYNGDFNYDGKVDASDYTLVDNAFDGQTIALPTAEVAPAARRSAMPAAVWSIVPIRSSNAAVPGTAPSGEANELLDDAGDARGTLGVDGI